MTPKKSLQVASAILFLAIALMGCTAQQASPPAASELPKADAIPRVAVEAQAAPAVDLALIETTSPSTQAEVANTERTERTAFYRADAAPPEMPMVQLSKREQALCKVNVGDPMPEIELPKLAGGGKAKLADMLGKKATVVVFWKGDRRMALEQLADMGPDVIEPFGKEGVAVVGIAANETVASAAEVLSKEGAKFANLLDADGKAFAQVGSERLPRTYVLDPNGKIVWFDIEYSLTTRRELHEAIRTLTGKE